jgi:cAMP-binding proteins - catabolite gene activator and regulatory subunit of cAMP-dependent protein kinases
MVRGKSYPLRRRFYEVLEQGPHGDSASAAVSRGLAFLVFVNIVAVVLESVPSLETAYGFWFDVIELTSLVVFSVEYILRLWVAAEHGSFLRLGAGRARLRYALSAPGLIDLAAILPFWLDIFLQTDLRFLLFFRILRFFKLGRYSPGMSSLLDAIYAERRALFGCLVLLSGAALVSGSLMYLVEGHVQPDKLGTIPDAMWWSIVTLGTIGYGDIIPVTATGRLIASLTIITGIMMIALPAGIIATAFSNEIHRRDFVITWALVARVPIFAELDAAEIAEIMRLLRAQVMEPGTIIALRGDVAQSMYVIASGDVEIALPDRSIRLGAGQFFGEIAVLRRARRAATVTAISRVRLLVLDAHDLHALMERMPHVATHIRKVARERLGHDLVTKTGDLTEAEIEEE